MIMGPMEIVRCLQERHGHCEMVSTCNVQSPLNELNRRLKEFYMGVRLMDLFTAKEPVTPMFSELELN
jgi:DNA-binding IscR family transcriptional regulator